MKKIIKNEILKQIKNEIDSEISIDADKIAQLHGDEYGDYEHHEDEYADWDYNEKLSQAQKNALNDITCDARREAYYKTAVDMYYGDNGYTQEEIFKTVVKLELFDRLKEKYIKRALRLLAINNEHADKNEMTKYVNNYFENWRDKYAEQTLLMVEF